MSFFEAPFCIRVNSRSDLTGKYLNVTFMPSRIYHSLGRGAVVREVRRNKNATLKLRFVISQDLSRVIVKGKGGGGGPGTGTWIGF